MSLTLEEKIAALRPAIRQDQAHRRDAMEHGGSVFLGTSELYGLMQSIVEKDGKEGIEAAKKVMDEMGVLKK